MPHGFKSGLTIDALLNSEAYVSAIAEAELDRKKHYSPTNDFKSEHPTKLEIQVANGQLGKPIATTTSEFDIGDHSIAKHFVVMTSLTGQS